jgi:hypothetical protein
MKKDFSKQYRKTIGFTSKSKCFDYLSAKDIILINWSLVDLYNERLIDIGERVQSQLTIKNDLNVKNFILDSFQIIKSNSIIENCFTNHGRGKENVYYSWMLGYLAEKLFSPLIQKELEMSSVVRSGGDDLSNPETFKRTSDPDFIDAAKNISVDVQCGVKGGKATIKKSKVDHAINSGYNGYAVTIGLGTGLYGIVNLNSLEHEKFVPNSSWEGALCWTAPDDIFKSWSK